MLRQICFRNSETGSLVDSLTESFKDLLTIGCRTIFLCSCGNQEKKCRQLLVMMVRIRDPHVAGDHQAMEMPLFHFRNKMTICVHEFGTVAE